MVRPRRPEPTAVDFDGLTYVAFARYLEAPGALIQLLEGEDVNDEVRRLAGVIGWALCCVVD